MTKNDYSVAEYEAVRAIALALIEARIRHNLEVQGFLDALEIFCCSSNDESRKIVQGTFPDRYLQLATYEDRIEQILGMTPEGADVTNYIPNLINDLRIMVEEDLDDF